MYATDKIMAMTADVLLGQESLESRDLTALFNRAENGEFASQAAKANPARQSKSPADPSGNDFAIACKLARQHGGNKAKVREEFLKQATPRPKLQRADYVNRTVRDASSA